jgi:hypothetical protein
MSKKAIQTRNQKKKQKIVDNKDDDEQSPLALLFTEQWRGIFETHILPKLRPKSELKFLKMAFKNARDAVERSKIDLDDEFNISEFTSISQMEYAWDNHQWGKNGRSDIQKWFCWKVAEMNKLEYLVWAREVKNCDWDWRTINTAVYQNNLAMVKYCVDNGCPMNANACCCAAENGHLDVLKYLHENDCPWDSRACLWARRFNRIDCLNYLIEQKAPHWQLFVNPPQL